jgi:hypothetical protein
MGSVWLNLERFPKRLTILIPTIKKKVSQLSMVEEIIAWII